MRHARPSSIFTALLGIVLLGMTTGVLAGAVAAPRVPASDDEVVATLPNRLGPAARQERQLRSQLQRQPGDLGLALRLARAAIERARRDGDPRELGVAQAALAPWWQHPDAPAPVRLLRATIRQSQHDFDTALTELDALLAAPDSQVALPVRAQAELTRAAVLQVRGRLVEASAGCTRLAGPRYRSLGDAVGWSARVCLAELASLQGHAAEADTTLAALAGEIDAQGGPGSAAWLALVRAELAERQDDPRAEALFRQAVQLQPDTYSRAAWADWLLDHGRAAEVLALIPEPDPTQLPDALLLRRAIALQRLQGQDTRRAAAATAASDALQERFDAAHARGDNTHRREEARYWLDLRGDARRALALAEANWAIQREPADARLLADTARAAGQPQAAAPRITLRS
jgi:hypothetical protein